MQLFIRVVESGSFTKAAERASITVPQVSRAIGELESRLRTRLLNRTTRRISLTEAGQRYFERAVSILSYVEEAEAEAADARIKPWGKLRIHATLSFGQHYMPPLIAEYHQRFPDVSTELVLAQRTPNFVEEGYDISVAVTRQLPDSSMIANRIGTTHIILCASPDYLDRRGTVRRVEDLREHTCLHLTLPDLPASQWPLEGPDGVVVHEFERTPFEVNAAEALEGAVAAGMGIGPLPVAVALPGLRAGNLRQVLPDYRLSGNHIYAIFASRQYVDAKIRTLVELLKEAVPLALKKHDLEVRVLSERLDVNR
ncbi:LysR family transcriptional regulator [Paraburkholderia sp. SG-MS1]|uniref:LysR family transcriptional regulator n=1 Tax=Paraburkholderia sp. SG-MS1 TaxID=2023741 RepID=UPI00313A2CFB